MSHYNTKFFIQQSKGSVRSAKEILPLVLRLVQPMSVVDVGCGIGSWLSVCMELFIDDVIGIDGSYINKSMLLIPEDKFITADLREPLMIGRTFDLVISMEVAEHIPKEYENIFIDSLVRLGSVILFSADIPHGGGVGHVNEQWQDYWTDLFLKRQYVVIDCVRPTIWDNENVMWWYRQNTLLFVKKNYLETQIQLGRMFDRWKGFPLKIVHPILLEEISNPKKMSFRKALSALPFGFTRALKNTLMGLKFNS